MKLSPKRAELLSLIAFVLQILFSLLVLLVSAQVYSPALRIEAWHFLGGTGIWLILLLQFRQMRLAREERLDAEQYQRLRREGKDTSVFESTAVEDSFQVSQRRLDWLEKYLLPTVALLNSAYLLIMGYWLLRQVQASQETILAGQDVVFKSAAFIAGIALISFLFSRYAVGMSRQAEWRPLRAGGSYLFSNALACFALAIVLILTSRYPASERVVQYVLVILMLAIGIENIWNLVLDAFSPRLKGRYRRAPFESRLLGLFSEPGGILHTFAQAIDYQFGFKVSDTWFFRLLSRTFIWLFLAMAATLYLVTSLAIVPSGNVAVLERFGEPTNFEQPLSAGLHLKWPWPIDEIRLFPVEQLQTVDVGFTRKDPIIDERTGRETPDLTPILWTKEHWKEEYPFMVAFSVSGQSADAAAWEQDAVVRKSDAVVREQDVAVRESEMLSDEPVARNDFDMLVVAFVVHYRIVDIKKYGYDYADPRTLLEAVCNRQVVHFCAESNIENLLGPGRHETSDALKGLIQKRVEDYGLGVKITFVGLESVHPPIAVAPSFENVVAALQEKQAKVLVAYGESNAIISMARGKSAERVYRARAYAIERSQGARAGAERFAQQLEAYRKGKNVYLWREYLSVLDEMLPDMRKYIITSDNVGHWVYELDLKEKLQPDLFEGLGINEEDKEN